MALQQARYLPNWKPGYLLISCLGQEQNWILNFPLSIIDPFFHIIKPPQKCESRLHFRRRDQDWEESSASGGNSSLLTKL